VNLVVSLLVHVIIVSVIFTVYLADWLDLWQITIPLLVSLYTLVEGDPSALHSCPLSTLVVGLESFTVAYTAARVTHYF
jgi:hypothetical protein